MEQEQQLYFKEAQHQEREVVFVVDDDDMKKEIVLSSDAGNGKERKVSTMGVLAVPESGTYYIPKRKIHDTLYGKIMEFYVAEENIESGALAIRISSSQNGNGKTNNECVAIKIYEKRLIMSKRNRNGAPCYEDPMNELTILKYLSNKGISHVNPIQECMQDDYFIYVVFPLFHDDLLDAVLRHTTGSSGANGFSENLIREIFQRAIETVSECHDAGVAHRDISLENFLMSEDGVTPYIIDFGLAKSIERDEVTNEWKEVKRHGIVGKYQYMAPEVYSPDSKSYDAFAADVWSIGCCLFISLCGFPLFEHATEKDANFKHAILEKYLIEVLKKHRSGISMEALDLMQRMLELKPEKRIKLTECLKHPFFCRSNTLQQARPSSP